jgi:hypothetical protein
MELTAPNVEVREPDGDLAGSALVPVTRLERRRDEIEALGLLVGILLVLLVLTVTLGAAPHA